MLDIPSLRTISTTHPTTLTTSFATVSLNNLPPSSSRIPLPTKLSAIARAGFSKIELGFPDLLAFACSFLSRDVKDSDYDDICKAGEEVKRLCAKEGLSVLMLQPFSNFEGWPKGSEGRAKAWQRARGWIRVMDAVGTDMLQVGATDTPSPPLTTSTSECASDLAALADTLIQHNPTYRICYENWCWATHGRTWRDVWSMVQLADRPNIGLCLDTFQTAGGEWGDPTTASGLLEEDGLSKAQLEERYRASLAELAKEVPAEKIYVLQISDGYKPPKPLNKEVDESGMRPRGQRSMAQRPLPYDGGYLPCEGFTRAVLQTGFRGVLSIEAFDGGVDGMGLEKDPEEYTKRAMGSLRRLIESAVEGKGL